MFVRKRDVMSRSLRVPADGASRPVWWKRRWTGGFAMPGRACAGEQDGRNVPLIV